MIVKNDNENSFAPPIYLNTYVQSIADRTRTIGVHLTTMSGFERLIRFIDENGTERYGNSPQPVDTDSIVGTSVDVLTGSIVDGFKETGEQNKVRKVSSTSTTLPPDGLDL